MSDQWLVSLKYPQKKPSEEAMGNEIARDIQVQVIEERASGERGDIAEIKETKEVETTTLDSKSPVIASPCENECGNFPLDLGKQKIIRKSIKRHRKYTDEQHKDRAGK